MSGEGTAAESRQAVRVVVPEAPERDLAPPSPQGPDAGTRASKGAIARRAIALLAVLAASAGFFVARATGELESCETKITWTSGTPAKVVHEEVCKPLPIESLVPALLLILALVWPDLASVELFGLGRVSRRLEEQDARQSQLESAQQRLETRIENSIQMGQVTNVFPASPMAALAVESYVEELQRRSQGVGAETSEDAAPEWSELVEAAAPLRPWLSVARRLNDPVFQHALTEGAASGSSADAPGLVPEDRQVLKQVQRAGHRFDVEGARRWAAENALQLDAVRDTLRYGPASSAESIRVATKFTRQLFSDLQRRGLVSDA